jgi:hypothetical protein
MQKLIIAFRHFSWQQKLAILSLVLVVVLTWLAVCLLLTGVIGA